MSTSETGRKNDISREKFKGMANDMKPIIRDMEGILNKYGIEGLSSLIISADGYFHFDVQNTDWEFKRMNSDAKPVISFHIWEEV